MEADFAVELGADDETLEIPWSAPGGHPRYYDLKHQPEMLCALEEIQRVPELAGFLRAVNSAAGGLEPAGMDPDHRHARSSTLKRKVSVRPRNSVVTSTFCFRMRALAFHFTNVSRLPNGSSNC